ncbi:MAG: histidinol dehydrogenase [Gammaproteobacteria bacterium]
MQQIVWAEMDEEARVAALARPAVTRNPDLDERVADIIAAVRAGGDAALIELTARFDGVDLESLRVGSEEFAAAGAQIGAEARAAIAVAIDNVEKFHAAQLAGPVRVETVPGVLCERITRPIRAVGLYVPAGSAPLPSTVVMLAVPGRLAAGPTRVIGPPPRGDGRADPGVLVAAQMCGVDAVYKVGGAQAIAALAYGTASIPKVDKIFGPGNSWVTAAKTAVAADPGGAAFDMPAGPSEVMVVADASANPRFVALDLLSQAEHGADSQPVLVCTDARFGDAVAAEIEAALVDLPRRAIIERSLGNALRILVDDVESGLGVANRYAPEHLILQVINARQYIDSIDNAGSIFVGEWAPESVGDYCSGTNHVLPTYGFARSYSGLSVGDFQKQLTVQELSRAGLERLAPTVRTLATLEGLDAHAAAVAARLTEAGATR